jgi:hypothetical protein
MKIRLNIVLLIIFSMNLILTQLTMADIHCCPSLEFGYMPLITILGGGRFNFEINPYVKPGFDIKVGFAFPAIGLLAGPDLEIYFVENNKHRLDPFFHTSLGYFGGESIGGGFQALIIYTSFGINIGSNKKSIRPFIEFGPIIYAYGYYGDLKPLIIQGGLRF